MRSFLSFLLLFILVLLLGPLWILVMKEPGFDGSWRDAPHTSTKLAPPPDKFKDAVVQVYAARAFSWRRAFGVHTWVAAKPKDGDQYMRYEAIGWRKFHDLPVVAIHNDYAPDAEWFGEKPVILKEIGGERAEKIIDKLDNVTKKYPWQNEYRVWPGPNSNTFTAYLAREIPELELDLPPTAVGKDFLGWQTYTATAPSGTGVQYSLGGLIGALWAEKEGLEFNILGLSFGFDFKNKRLRYPGIGYLP